jgi:ABC-type methionine transport system ATPase subunit
MAGESDFSAPVCSCSRACTLVREHACMCESRLEIERREVDSGEGFSMAGEPASKWQVAKQEAAKVLEIINRLPTIDSFSEQGLKPSESRGEIELTDVVFAYPTAVDHKVCNGLSLHIPPGTTMALCGASGSGKSTVIQLLERFYDPMSGIITLDGLDITTLNVRWLRSQLGLVGQEPVLFQGTVAQNIAYGKLSGASQAEIEEAAKAANAHGFITSDLQDGYDTQVGLKGGFLSGGQKQRVAIARALIKKPAVLLLDEATSALDNKSEAVVQAALDDVMAKYKITTIVIAHRLSTIRNANCIAVFKKGCIEEKGSYDELMAHGGLFYTLAKKQEEIKAADKRTLDSCAVVSSVSPVANLSPVDIRPVEDKGFSERKIGVVKASGSEKEETEETDEKSMPMMAAICRLFGIQKDYHWALVLMFLLSAGVTVCPSVAFYQMTEAMTILYDPTPEAMRDDALRISALLGILAAITIVGMCVSV